MNKAPQPTGPPPAPSPGLPQPAFPPGQTAPVVFNTPQATQMNTPSQPRQHFYPSRAQPPSSAASRVQSAAPARPGPAAHVYPAGSQVMMIPSQISYPASQGAYYIPGQGRSTYVVPTQQYPVQPGAPSFYPGASPTEFGTYAGAYYPAQGVQQFPTGVAPAPVLMNQPPQIAPRRERKTIRIRDPNQGGKDITEEIMSGARTASTPTPPQTGGGLEPQANGETPQVAVVVRPDDRSQGAIIGGRPGLPDPEHSPSESQPSSPSPTPSPPPILEPGSEPNLTILSGDTMTTGMIPVEESAPMPRETGEPYCLSPEPTPLAEPILEVEVTLTKPMPDSEFSSSSLQVPTPLAPQKVEILPEPNGTVPSEDLEPEVESSPELAPLPPPACLSESPVPIAPTAQPEELLNGAPSPPAVDLSPVSEPKEQAKEDTASVAPATVLSATPTVAPPATSPTPEEEIEEEEEGGGDSGETEGEKEGEELLSPESTPVPAHQSQNLEAAAATQVAVSVPKRRRKIKELNKKETVGDLLDAFKEVTPGIPEVENQPPPVGPEPEGSSVLPRPEEADETWDSKEDKIHNAENIQPGEQKYEYKSDQWKPLNLEEKKRYDREFLLGFQFIFASMQKPEGLPHITDVVLDKANKTPLRPLDPTRLSGINCGPDFTPSFANLGRPALGSRGPPRGGPGGELPRGPQAGLGTRRSQPGLRKEPRKIIATVLMTEDIKLNKAEKAWKPSSKRTAADKDRGEEDADGSKTQDLFRRVRSILNKLTPQMFQQLMKQVTQLAIDTEERLKGVIDLIFEKAISEPNFSVAYANMCRCLMALKVPTTEKPTVTVNFRKLLLNRCQKEFEKDKDDDEVFEKKQKEMDEAATAEERGRLKEELEEARDIARRRSLGNIKFIGELFKLKMLTEAIMHDCVVKLLKNHDEESLECLCRLLTTIGKDLDFEKAKPRMDQYFQQMEKIIKEKKTSSRIRFMLQDVLDLRRSNWVPRRGDQGPKTIDQIHKEAEMEEHREHIKVQQLMAKGSDKRRGGLPGPPINRGLPLVDDGGWNTVPISKGSRPIDTSRLTKITKPGSIDSNNQLFAPGGRMSWGKGSSGGSAAKPSDAASEAARPATSTVNRFSALQQTVPTESTDNRRVVQRSSLSRERGEKAGDRGDRLDRSERGGDRGDRLDRARTPATKRSFSKEVEERSRERPSQPEGLRKAASLTEDRDRGRDAVKREATLPPVSPTKATLSEEEMEKKSKAIIEEYLHLNDMKEAVQCVQELASPSLLFIFVRHGIGSTLERTATAREHMGRLLHQLLCAGHLSLAQYYRGLYDILEIVEEMEIDIPHVWLYLAELITPILQEGGVPMGELFREITKPLKPLGKAASLLLEILGLLCKSLGPKKVGMLWREAGLGWKEFLPEGQDVGAFIADQKVDYTLGEESEAPGQRLLSSEELSRQLEKLLKEGSSDQRILDWIEANLSEQQVASNTFVRVLMTTVCNSAIIFETPLRVDVSVLKARAKLLQKYLCDEQKELQALYALQALVVTLEQPANLLRTFFDALYDEDVVKEDAFYSWESSKDPAEQQGKGVALKSVTAFFKWLREAEEEESDHN
ncbi:eukaryotic translation initiation factor 4 gamma 1 isoform X1 [Talpa occidentalis]|uniref:eukaryotic translation initiation factor 4 gamma 1 isoform X1 n=1 Tax=Talpa occidentalis TaxID=50954 RepID=UPI00188EA9A5|nr:eukaryotic translation initiation factor 4 gamma 1 isoform X1 [Talpa occidentalis]XP_037381102.1 eukaryotic translation initiation factor 4 gamma 1 isoform X1 [Talpa occidentalis]